MTGVQTCALPILFAEMQGATGVVLNDPTSNEVLSLVRHTVDIPVVVTVARKETDFEARLKAGADIFNVSAAADTPDLVRRIKDAHPDVPVIATGGPTEESIMQTIAAGANAITWTPPSNGEVFRDIMAAYREGCLLYTSSECRKISSTSACTSPCSPSS